LALFRVFFFVLFFLNFLLLAHSQYISRNSAICSPGFYFSPDRIVSATTTAADISAAPYFILCVLVAYLSTPRKWKESAALTLRFHLRYSKRQSIFQPKMPMEMMLIITIIMSRVKWL
jgi:hypothetical protein